MRLAPTPHATTPLPWGLSHLAARDDAQVAELLGSAAIRQDALVAALASLGSSVVWSGAHGRLRLEVVLPDGELEAATVWFDGVSAQLAPTDEHETVLRVPLVPLVRLLTGQADGALLYLAGVLQIVGREDLVLALGTGIRVGPDARPLVDPAALDPLAVSRAIAGVGLDHLSVVMAGGFRHLVLSEVFGRLPEFVLAEKAARVRVGVAFEIGGRDDGLIDRYVVRILDGACTVVADPTATEDVDATLELDGHEFLRLVLGHLNPVRGVLSGQVKVRGQVVKALGFNAVMQIPGT